MPLKKIAKLNSKTILKLTQVSSITRPINKVPASAGANPNLQ